jgi:hypothetical protein
VNQKFESFVQHRIRGRGEPGRFQECELLRAAGAGPAKKEEQKMKNEAGISMPFCVSQTLLAEHACTYSRPRGALAGLLSKLTPFAGLSTEEELTLKRHRDFGTRERYRFG